MRALPAGARNRRTRHLVGGHQRFKVLVAEGARAVDVSVVDLPPAQERTLNVALNRIEGAWDDLKLAELLAGLQTDESIDATVTGFDDDEIRRLRLQANLAEDSKAHGNPAGKLHGCWKVIADCVDASQQKEVETLLRERDVACHTRSVE